MKRYLLLALLIASPAHAEEMFSAKEKQDIMKLTLDKFWGMAVDTKGKPIMPKDDIERTSMPIPREKASYIIDKGAESGLAMWCNVAWEERFHLLMKRARLDKYSEKQMAYVGVLHGVAQGMINSSMENHKCDFESKKQIEAIIKEDTANIKKSL